MTSQLVGSDYTDGALLPNYVNGRLLVAEDLATSQASLRTRDTRVGEAAGAGIVRGLWVSNTATTLTVAAGLAVGAGGEPVVVPKPVTLQLTFATAAAVVDDSSFACCGPVGSDGQGASLTSGVFLLTVRPACRLEGQAPLMPPPGSAVSPCCTAQWRVEGVEFRTVALPVPEVVAGVTVGAGNRRNLVAHWCFGSEQLVALGGDPFGFDPKYSGLSQLDPADLTADDIPLAVFSWDGTSVADLDNWSARRRITDSDPTPSSWSVTVADRRVSEGQARFLQFQDHAESLVSRGLAGSAVVADYFGLLPPVGFLPVGNDQFRKVAERSLREVVARQARSAAPMTEYQAEKEAAAVWRQREESVPLKESTGSGQSASPMTGGFDMVDLSDAYGGNMAGTRPEFYKALVEMADVSVGYGYDPETFFGSLAGFGGLIDWEVAEWALDQSWRAMPVRTASSAVDVVVGDDSSGERVQPPITYYYVLQNLLAADSATQMYRMASRFTRQQFGISRSNLYVVFIAGRRWFGGARIPIIDLSIYGQVITASRGIDDTGADGTPGIYVR